MCGIAGLVSPHTLPADTEQRVLAMRDVLAHRGPDDAGLFVDERAALGHRRLSIVDIRAGHQPLANEDGTVWVVFNGEIYNHADVRHELEAYGHHYRTKSDTETIVHAYEQWGDACVDRFRGMFAFAVWDAPRRRLLLARDRLGVKPLYWTRTVSGCLLFGSEIKALLASGMVEPEANAAAIPELLSTRSIAGSETMFRRVHKLLPGHVLAFEDGVVRIRKYWDLPVHETASPASERFRIPGRTPASARADVVARFRSLLEESVRLRLMSDVPLGVFLSGGIDSSAIAAVMAPMLDQPLQTFSVAFKEQAFNELEYARAVARAIGANAHEVVIDDRDFFDALPRLVWHEDEPVAHPSSVPLFYVSALARQHVTVVLTGEGSDELMAGYGKYLRTAWNWRAGGLYERVVPKRIRRAVAERVVPHLPGRVGRTVDRTFLAMERAPEWMLWDNFAAIRLRDQQRLLAAAIRGSATATRAFASSLAHFQRPNGRSTLLDRLLYADMKTYLVELLMKQDQMSMAASIESRVPFLDHKLVEFVAGLPDDWKLAGLTTKRVLRESLKGLLPEQILKRPKMGFPVPFGPWMRSEWRAVAYDVLLDRRSRERGIVEPRAVERLLDDHAGGRTDGAARIWSLLNLELWHRTFIDKEGVQTLPSVHVQPAKPSATTARAPANAPALSGPISNITAVTK